MSTLLQPTIRYRVLGTTRTFAKLYILRTTINDKITATMQEV